MSRKAVTAFLDMRAQLWMRGDAQALAQTHAEDGILSSPLFGTLEGREAIAASYYQIFAIFERWELTATHTIIEDQRIVQFFSAQAVHRGDLFGMPATGRRFEIHPVLLLEIDDQGLIAHESRRYDFSGMLIQLGVLRARPGRES